MLPRLILLSTLMMTCFVVSATDAGAAEIVKYRAEKWQAKHIHDDKKAKTISATLKKLGCEVKQGQHNGHIDVKYPLPQVERLGAEDS